MSKLLITKTLRITKNKEFRIKMFRRDTWASTRFSIEYYFYPQAPYQKDLRINFVRDFIGITFTDYKAKAKYVKEDMKTDDFWTYEHDRQSKEKNNNE